MKNFEGFGLSETLNVALSRMNFKEPTPIQAQAIPLALQGRDILGSAQTGTGKTGAFAIPLIESLLNNPRGMALVLLPTRELAKQVLDAIHQMLGHQSGIKTAFIIGGEPMGKQFSQLRARPRIIVGTPGRINDHLRRGTMMLHDAGFLVLDETDRMLDMGFGVQLEEIFKFMPEKRQTLMFSATLPKEIIAISEKYLNNPERVSMGATNTVAKNIQQEIIRINHAEKYTELVKQLHERNGTVIIFSKTKFGTEKMAQKLNRDGFDADALHGDLKQTRRTRVMDSFRKKKFRILVATDIAARGLDVPHIEHVINYDLPQVAEDYIHRMGRTARAGACGSALCFISPEEGRKWRAIEELLGIAQPSNSNVSKTGHRGNRKNNVYGSPSKWVKKPGAKSTGGNAGGSKSTRPWERKKQDDAAKRGGETSETRGNFKPKRSYNDGNRDMRDDRNTSDERRDGKPSGFKKKSYGGKPVDRSNDRPFEKSDKKPFKKFEGNKFEGKKFDGQSRNTDGERSGESSGKKFARRPRREDGKPSTGAGAGFKGKPSFKKKFSSEKSSEGRSHSPNRGNGNGNSKIQGNRDGNRDGNRQSGYKGSRKSA